jgi:hypothetical protein
MEIKSHQVLIAILLLFTVFSNVSLWGKDVNISVDPRMELLGIVQYLSGYEEKTGLITDYEFGYKREIDAYFSEYEDHPAVQKFASLSSLGFSFDAPAAAMLHLSDPPELEIIRPFTAYLKRRAWGEDNLKDFVEKLRDFVEESNFMEFYSQHSSLYRTITENVEAKIEGRNYVDILEDYFGMENHSYNIILALLFHPGGFGPRLERDDGRFDIYNICGPHGVEDDIPHFGTEKYFNYLAWHEFSHSFINPLTSKFHDQVEQYEDLIKPVKELMSSQAYPSWPIIVNEHVVRAVTTRLAYINDGSKEGKRALNKERARGFIYFPALLNKLKQYENSRDKYPTFESFYPVLLTAFEDYIPEYIEKQLDQIPFSGSINKAMGNMEEVVMIIPTHEDDKETEESLHDYVAAVKERIFPEARILTDEEALIEDLSDFSIVAYGTLDGNSYLSMLKEEFPFKIDSASITTDSVYQGAHLRFISCWRNPENPQNGMVIYTAQKAEDIIQINSVFHGPTDYLIARNLETLADEFYDKSEYPWTF